MGERYCSSNAEQLIREYEPLISKCACKFHNRYRSIIDFEDARQEVRLLFYRCLKTYNKERASFIAYFNRAFGLLMSRFYYTHSNNININQKRVDPKVLSDEESNSGITAMEEMGVLGKTQPLRSVRPYLSKEAKEVWDLLMYDNRANPFMLHKRLGLSRLYAKRRYQSFVDEISQAKEFISIF